MERYFSGRAAIGALLLWGGVACGVECDPMSLSGLRGGLVVQLGAGDVAVALGAAKTGRYVVQVLDTNIRAVEAAREEMGSSGRYGLVTAAAVGGWDHLPYSEDLVNLVIVRSFDGPMAEVGRVLVPGGTVIAPKGYLDRERLMGAGFESVEERGPYMVGRKRRSADMDEWSHPRHDAGGNAVSADKRVGPPRRVRWIAGATREAEGLVTSGGRNFYGGVIGRDSFNGLRLWHMDLKGGQRDASDFQLPQLAADRARPVATDRFLYAVVQNAVVAIDARSGEVVREFQGLGRARELLHVGDTLIATSEDAVRAFRVGDAEPSWRFDATYPRGVVAGSGLVVFLHGSPPKIWPAKNVEAVAVDMLTGRARWKIGPEPWLNRAARIVMHDGHLAFEESTLTDDDAGNALHLISLETGQPIWERAFPPGMNHRRQARAMFIGDKLWILHGGKTNTVDKEHIRRLPVEVSALDIDSGETRVTYPAGLAHCFPPVASERFLFSGVMDMTDLGTGKVVANRITKAHCSAENGWVPANGLIYTTPKHCTCWPLLRGYVALAPAKTAESGPKRGRIGDAPFSLERVTSIALTNNAPPAGSDGVPNPDDWPMYRADAWRSGSTAGPGPRKLERLWTTKLASVLDATEGPVLHDWRENPFVKGPLSAPVIACGLAYVSRADAHEVVAVDANSGEVRWRFTADGRIDTPPAIHRGVCLFGTHRGSVYALRADSGKPLWRLNATPDDEQIVAYGQLESPWPIPGAVLVADGVAYFVAGRQPFADGGVIVAAIDPMTGERRWVRRIDTVPQQDYYESSALEFDAIDIPQKEGGGIAMSRWIISGDGKRVTSDKWNGFAKLDTGGGAAWVPRGCWNYGARHQSRFPGEPQRRSLAVFRDGTIFGVMDGSTEIFRRDFDAKGLAQFKSKWITGWESSNVARQGGKPYRSYRVAEGSKWTADDFTSGADKAKPLRPGSQLQNDIHAMALGGDGRLFAMHKDGRLKAIDTDDGSVLGETLISQPVWDGVAIAGGRLYVATQSGDLVCLGARDP